MNSRAYIWAMIIGSVILEAVCFYNLYFLKSGGLSIMLIIPVMSLVAGIYLLFATKDKKDNDDKED